MALEYAEPFSRSEPETFARPGYVMGMLNHRDDDDPSSSEAAKGWDDMMSKQLQLLIDSYRGPQKK